MAKRILLVDCGQVWHEVTSNERSKKVSTQCMTLEMFTSRESINKPVDDITNQRNSYVECRFNSEFVCLMINTFVKNDFKYT
jgi:hypothetical protein